jgi:hypothetical protein
MPRTKAQNLAAERDGRFCLWHFHRLMGLVPATEVHHIFRAYKWDTKETCVSLCHECHMDHHAGNGPNTDELVALMVELYGYDYEALGVKWKPRAETASGP